MQKLKSLLIYIPFLLLLYCCNNDYSISEIDYQLIKIDSNLQIEDDSTAIAIIAPYKQKLDSIMKDTIGYCTQDLIIETPEGTMNNYIADVLLKTVKSICKGDDKPIDFCMINIGGLRKSIGKGVITRSDIYELMPFDNKLVVVELKGSDVKLMLDYIARTGGTPVSGIKMGIENKKPISVNINGKVFDSERKYIVLTNDYLADGGDDMTFFMNPISRLNLDIIGRDAIINDIIEKNNLARSNSYNKSKI